MEFEQTAAKEGSDVPELPSFITLLNSKFHEADWVHTLHTWEAVFFSLVVAVLISVTLYLAGRKRDWIPSGLQNAVEYFVESLNQFIVSTLGEDGVKYLPFLGTLFVYIFTMNMMGLVPFMKAPSSNVNITAGLAIVVFVFVQYLNIKNMGIGGFLYHMAGSPKNWLGWVMVPLMFPLEVMTQLTRPLTLAFRLFGNVMGEDILIGVFALFGLSLLADFHSPVGVPLQLPFMFLALLTGTMQALVFTLLSTVYILLSKSESH